MRTTLEWATLLVCCAALLLRVPDAVRGRNRTVFGILLLGTMCSVLAVSELYEAIDGALGGWDLTSLILRYLVFAAVLLVGLRVTRGLAAARAHQLIAGRNRALGAGARLPGRDGGVLPDGRLPGHRPGCPAPAGGAGDADLAPYFTAAGRTYPAFVSLVLVPPLLAAVRSRLPRLVRAGALLVLLGAVFAVLSLSGRPDAVQLGRRAAFRQLRGGPGLRRGPRRVLVFRADREPLR